MELQHPQIRAIEARFVPELAPQDVLDLGPEDPDAAATRIAAARKELSRARPRKPIVPPKYRVDDPRRRPAKNARERWTQAALITLAAADPDYASELNAVGFNQADTHEGHRLAVLVGSGGLNDADWDRAVRLCRKYMRQVGKMADSDDGS